MTSFESFNDMGDIRLKPKILRNLLSYHLPNEKQPLTNFQSISKVVSTLTTHNLLSESPVTVTETKRHSKSKTAVDDWFDRLSELVSSDTVDKCWVGICLIGVTCRECTSERFIGFYSVWFNSLLSHLKNPESSRIVRVASCTSISDLLTRLSRFPNIKKDAVSHASKVILPIVRLLEEDSSEALWEGAVGLLSTIVTVFPFAFRGSYDQVEAVIASKIFSVKTSPDMLKKFAHFLALLPKSKGDGATWSLMMRKLLISINVHLNDFFQGLEDETKGTEAIRRLVPPGKDAPPPLGGKDGELDDAACNSEQLVVSRVSALMYCTSTMLTSSYKSKINIPVGSLLLLVERVLAVNGSLPRAMSAIVAGIQQELVCAELPTLHSYTLELLSATIKSIQSQLLPYAASVVRLVSSYFRKCTLPELRIRLYSITKTLLKSMGVGMAMQLAQDVVINASADLDTTSVEVVATNKLSLLKSSSKKRKHSTNSGVEAENSAFELGVPHNHSSSPVSLKIAALDALETLLTIGGALGSDSWKERVDNLLMTVSRNACDGRWAIAESTTSLVDFQIASLRAFLASLVSPSRVRPLFLSEGLELFRRGKLQGEMKVAEFCSHAIMSLEVVIHPRGLPHDGLPLLDNTNNGVPHAGDDLRKKWLEKADVPSTNEIQKSVDTTFLFQESKRSKVGNGSVTVESVSVEDDTDMVVASENVQQVDAHEEKVPEPTEAASLETTTVVKDGYQEVASETQEGDDLAVKDSFMEEVAETGNKKESSEHDESSIASLEEGDFGSDSESDIES